MGNDRISSVTRASIEQRSSLNSFGAGLASLIQRVIAAFKVFVNYFRSAPSSKPVIYTRVEVTIPIKLGPFTVQRRWVKEMTEQDLVDCFPKSRDRKARSSLPTFAVRDIETVAKSR